MRCVFVDEERKQSFGTKILDLVNSDSFEEYNIDLWIASLWLKPVPFILMLSSYQKKKKMRLYS